MATKKTKKKEMEQEIIKQDVVILDAEITKENIFDDHVYPNLAGNLPEKEYYEIPIDDKGTTLLSMLNIMGPEELEFVLHLAYTLWKSDKEQKESAA